MEIKVQIFEWLNFLKSWIKAVINCVQGIFNCCEIPKIKLWWLMMSCWRFLRDETVLYNAINLVWFDQISDWWWLMKISRNSMYVLYLLNPGWEYWSWSKRKGNGKLSEARRGIALNVLGKSIDPPLYR